MIFLCLLSLFLITLLFLCHFENFKDFQIIKCCIFSVTLTRIRFRISFIGKNCKHKKEIRVYF